MLGELGSEHRPFHTLFLGALSASRFHGKGRGIGISDPVLGLALISGELQFSLGPRFLICKMG